MFSITYFPYTQVLAVLIMCAICFFERYVAKYQKILYCFSVVCMAVYPICITLRFRYNVFISIPSALLSLRYYFVLNSKNLELYTHLFLPVWQ